MPLKTMAPKNDSASRLDKSPMGLGHPARLASLARPARPARLASLANVCRWPLLISLPLALILFCACGSLIPGGGSVRPPRDFSSPQERVLIPNVPFIPDSTSHCGPATLAAVMTYKGRKTTRPEVAIDIQRTDLRGAMGPDMVLWAREKGMEARFAASNLKELLASIKNQNPVIVLLDVGLGPVRKGHFAVAVGYGPEGLIVNSGMIQQQILPWPDFVKQWRKMRNFSIFVTGLAKSRPQPPAPGVGPGPGPGSGQGPGPDQGPGPGQRPGQGKGPGQGASRGAPLDDDNRVLSPTKVSQQLNLPEGVDVPEEMTSAVTPPKYELPTQKVPDFLSGAELPQAGEIPQNPIVDMTGRAPVVAPISPDDEEEIESSALSGQSQGQGNEGAVKIHETGGSKPSQDEGPAKAGADLKVVMEPLPLPGEEDSGGGFSETDLGNPLILPVVPLPEDQPITGSKMGSDFKGPATVPGAVTPNQASQTAKAEGDKAAQAPVNKAAGENQDGTKAAEEEELPVMEWERQ